VKYCALITNINGVSVFANKKFVYGEVIGEYVVLSNNGNGRKLHNGMYESDILGRYCNHNTISNTNLIETKNNTIILITNEDINIGDEITTNYSDLEKLLNAPPLTYYKEYFNNTKLYDFGKTIID
jgi:hypothetical protein